LGGSQFRKIKIDIYIKFVSNDKLFSKIKNYDSERARLDIVNFKVLNLAQKQLKNFKILYDILII